MTAFEEDDAPKDPPPGGWDLNQLHCEIIAEPGTWQTAPRCKCSGEEGGRWCFAHQGALWEIFPSDQIAKDQWLMDDKTEGPVGERARVKALRWMCLECGSVRLPNS